MTTAKLTPARERIVSWAANLAKYQAELARLKAGCDAEIVELQTACTHPVTKHHPRPCAEADSWDECVDCGKIIYC